MIEGSDLVFHKGADGTIMAGGFSVESMMSHRGGGIVTMNQQGGRGGASIGDIFKGMVIPCGLLYHPFGKEAPKGYQTDSDDDDVASDSLIDSLLDLVKPKSKPGTRKHRSSVNKTAKRVKN
jgi:hypothetical protein